MNYNSSKAKRVLLFFYDYLWMNIHMEILKNVSQKKKQNIITEKNNKCENMKYHKNLLYYNFLCRIWKKINEIPSHISDKRLMKNNDSWSWWKKFCSDVTRIGQQKLIWFPIRILSFCTEHRTKQKQTSLLVNLNKNQS